MVGLTFYPIKSISVQFNSKQLYLSQRVIRFEQSSQTTHNLQATADRSMPKTTPVFTVKEPFTVATIIVTFSLQQ